MRNILRIILTAAILFSLVGCANSSTKIIQTQAKLAYHSNINDNDLLALKDFAEFVYTNTQGTVKFELINSTEPAATFKNKEADFVLQHSSKIVEINPNLKFVVAPYLYKSYNHFAMSARSDYTYTLLNNILKDHEQPENSCTILANFLQGSDFLLSTESISRENELLQLIENSSVSNIILSEKSVSHDYFEAMGLQIFESDSANSKIDALNSGSALIVELSSDELINIDISSKKTLNVIKDYHNNQSQWLFVNTSFFDNLSKKEQAVITEGIAYLYPLMENYYTYQSSLVIDKLVGHKSIIHNNPTGFYEQIDDSVELIRTYDDDDFVGNDIFNYVRKLEKLI